MKAPHAIAVTLGLLVIAILLSFLSAHAASIVSDPWDPRAVHPTHCSYVESPGTEVFTSLVEGLGTSVRCNIPLDGVTTGPHTFRVFAENATEVSTDVPFMFSLIDPVPTSTTVPVTTTTTLPVTGPINVSTSGQLMSAVASVNASGGNREIILADGTYQVTGTINVTSPNVRLRSASGNRASVIIQGDAMSASAVVKNLIRVAAKGFRIQDLTLRRAGWHLIQIAGELDADNAIIRNVIFRDGWEQMLKISYNPDNMSVSSDNGILENSLFEFSAGQAGQYYTSGIDAHNAKKWIVRGNVFRNIRSPGIAVAEHAIHFWSLSEDTLVERNLIIDCDRGIGFGLTPGRGHIRGVIRNNMVYHAANKGSFADVGIEVAEADGAKIYNNTVFSSSTYPNSIEYRFPTSSDPQITNNLTNRVIKARDGASATVTSNLTSAVSTWFKNVSAGDLHLLNATVFPVDAGEVVPTLVDDYDGELRGSLVDVGADEVMGVTTTTFPTTTTLPIPSCSGKVITVNGAQCRIP